MIRGGKKIMVTAGVTMAQRVLFTLTQIDFVVKQNRFCNFLVMLQLKQIEKKVSPKENSRLSIVLIRRLLWFCNFDTGEKNTKLI